MWSNGGTDLVRMDNVTSILMECGYAEKLSFYFVLLKMQKRAILLDR